MNKDGGFKMNITLLGIDIAKNVFQLHGVGKKGEVLLKKRLARSQLMPYIKTLPACMIVMEACGGANHWCRQFSSHGHQVKLISPQYVKPFVKTNKNDRNDAQAIVEAASRPTMYFVAPKTIAYQDIQAVHRVRQRYISQRTAIVNQARGLLAEYGIVISRGIGHIRSKLPDILEDAEKGLMPLFRSVLSDLYEELLHCDAKIKNYDKQLESICQHHPDCQRLLKIPGFGVVTATALVSAVGDASVFKNGRQMSAWLGLVPRQHSSGNKNILLGISKRGDCYLRKTLVHGARSVVYRARHKTDQRSRKINNISLTRGYNKASVAVANRNVRMAWSLLKHKTEYKIGI